MKELKMDGEIYASLERDATKEQSVLIPAQTAQRFKDVDPAAMQGEISKLNQR